MQKEQKILNLAKKFGILEQPEKNQTKDQTDEKTAKQNTVAEVGYQRKMKQGEAMH